MRISKSLLELAHQLASQPVTQHSPKGNYISKPVVEETMTDAQKAKREEIVKAMKRDAAGLKKRYGEDWENVMYATATKKAMMSEEELLEYEKYTDEHGVTWNDEGDSDKGHTKWGKGPMWRGPKKHYHYVPYKDKEHAKSEGMRWDKEKRAWYHTDAGKSATSKFRKLHEEEILEEGSVGHKFIVTTSDPNHPLVSMRKETKMNIIKVREVDKEKAKKRAIDFYKKKGLKVHDVEHHSELREGTGE